MGIEIPTAIQGSVSTTGYLQVDTYSDLPPASNNENSIYYVEQSTNTLWVNRRTRGFYFSNGTDWLIHDNPQSTVETARSVGTTSLTDITIGSTSHKAIVNSSAVTVASLSANSLLKTNTDKELTSATFAGINVPNITTATNDELLFFHATLFIQTAVSYTTIITKSSINHKVADIDGQWWYKTKTTNTAGVTTAWNYFKDTTNSSTAQSGTYAFQFKIVHTLDSNGNITAKTPSKTE